MMSERDWEAELGQREFDFAKERWARLEVDLMRRIREPVTAPTWRERLVARVREWSAWLRPAPVAAGLASLFLSLAWWTLREHKAPVTMVAMEEIHGWQAGEILHSDTLKIMNWIAARCTLALEGDVMRLADGKGEHLRLEKGRIRLAVHPRAEGEVLDVEFGQCKATVVGTAFTLQVDSLGSKAWVEHGKVRVDGPGWSRFLTQGQSLVCGDLQVAGPTLIREPLADSTPVVASKPSPSVKRAPSSDREWDELWSRCRTPSEKCTEALATYLQTHPKGERAAKAAGLWADRSLARGDFRDALYALDLAAQADAGELSFQARLKACTVKARDLQQTNQALKELDQLLESLPEGARRTRALQLRTEFAAREKNVGAKPANLP
jgi:hypothetical protein